MKQLDIDVRPPANIMSLWLTLNLDSPGPLTKTTLLAFDEV